MHHFGTLYDINYLSRGLALLHSMQEHIPNFRLYVLCLDRETLQYWQAHPTEQLVPIALEEVEDYEPELLEAKQNRSLVEYYFTLSPVWPLFLLDKFPEIDLITTLDADIYFFSDPTPIFQELEKKSILITPHRFGEKLKHSEVHGKYNVSFQSFRRNRSGQACLAQWREQCLEWCYDTPENDRFADQKYLDVWPDDFKDVQPMQHPGAGLAPWNACNYTYQLKNGKIYLDDKWPLIFYHFHGFRFVKPRVARHALDFYHCKPHKLLKNEVYKPYMQKILFFNEQLKSEKETVARNTNREFDKHQWFYPLVLGNAFWLTPKGKIVEIRLRMLYKKYRELKKRLRKQPDGTTH